MNNGYNDLWGVFPRNEFHIDPCELIIDEHNRYLMSGRTCLDYIIKDMKLKKTITSAYLPSYCSQSMILPFIANDISVRFYPVKLVNQKIHYTIEEDHKCDVVVLLDYFGFHSQDLSKYAFQERKQNHTLIIDCTQSFLCDYDYRSISDYCFISYRKWLSSSAAYVFSREGFSINNPYRTNDEYELLRERAFNMYDNKIKALSLLDASDQILSRDYSLYTCSQKEIHELSRIDWAMIKSIRRRNAQLLIDGLKHINQLFFPFSIIKDSDCPLCIPVILKNRNRRAFIDYLVSRGIDITFHWNYSNNHPKRLIDNNLYFNEVSLAIDQQLGKTEIERNINVIRDWFNQI